MIIIKQIFGFVKRENEQMNEKHEKMIAYFDKIYTDGRALQYINAYWSEAKTERSIKWLNEPFSGRTLKDCFLKDTEAAGDFIAFAEDCRE